MVKVAVPVPEAIGYMDRVVGGTWSTSVHAPQLVTNVSDSPLLDDSASATTNLNCPVDTTPFGGDTWMLDRVRFTIPPALVTEYRSAGNAQK